MATEDIPTVLELRSLRQRANRAQATADAAASGGGGGGGSAFCRRNLPYYSVSYTDTIYDFAAEVPVNFGDSKWINSNGRLKPVVDEATWFWIELKGQLSINGKGGLPKVLSTSIHNAVNDMGMGHRDYRYIPAPTPPSTASIAYSWPVYMAGFQLFQPSPDDTRELVMKMQVINPEDGTIVFTQDTWQHGVYGGSMDFTAIKLGKESEHTPI